MQGRITGAMNLGTVNVNVNLDLGAAESSIGPSVAAEKAAMMRCWGPCVRPSTTQPAALGSTLWSKLLHLCYGLRACKGQSRMARTHALLADTPRVPGEQPQLARRS